MRYFSAKNNLLYLAISLTMVACTRKSDSDELVIKGSVSVADGKKDGVLIIGLSNKPFAEFVKDPVGSLIKTVATKDLNSYEIRIPKNQLGSGNQVQLVGFLKRDFDPSKAPSIAKGDQLGFAVSGIKPGITIPEKTREPIYADLSIDRTARGRDVSLNVEIKDAEAGQFLTGLYCDEIRGLSLKQLDTKHVTFVQPFEKKLETETFTMKFPLFQASEKDHCYLFTAKDTNRNLTIDPGEYFGFYTNRKDKLPTLIDLKNQVETLHIEADRNLQKGNDASILVKGRLSTSPEIRGSMKRFYVIAVKYDPGAFSPEGMIKNIIGFSQLQNGDENFEIDVTESIIRPGEEITVFALGDQKDMGLPALDDGDALGLAIENQTVARKKLSSGVNLGFDVQLKGRYFSGQSKVNVRLESDYVGPMLLVGYRGPLTLDVSSIDTSKVVGFTTFDKSEKNASASLPVYGLGENWPLKLYVLGVLDGNRNQKIDPGEILQLPLSPDGQPEALTIQNGETLDYKLTYLYTTQVPSPYNFSVSGRLHINSNVTAPYVTILVAQAADPNVLLRDPVKYIKAAQRVPTISRQYKIPLTNTSLRPGEKIQIMALTSESNEDFPRLNDKTLVGLYAGRDQGHILSAGDNNGLDIVVDRSVYRDVVSILGTFESDYRGPVITTLFKGDPIALLNQKFRISDFVAFSKVQKETDKVDIEFHTLISNEKLPVNVMPILIEDQNGNDFPDPGEVAHYSIDHQTKNPLLLRVTPSLVTSFTFNQEKPIPLRSQEPLSLTGKIRVAQNARDAQIFIIVLDGDLKSLAPEDIARHTIASQRVSAAAPEFAIDLAEVGVKAGDKIMIAALADKDNDGFPRLTTNDLLGFHTEGDSFLYTLQKGINGPIQIAVDRAVFDGKATVEGTVFGSKNQELLVVAYAGEIESLTNFEPSPSQILGFTSTGGTANFELDVNPFGASFPVSPYIIGIADTNNNQALDPGERIYYFSQRADGVPEKTLIDKGQKVKVALNLSLEIQKALGHDIRIAGRLSWPKISQIQDQSAFLFVARGDSIDEIRNRPLKAIRYLEKLEGHPENYSISLADTDLAPGEKVFVGIWIDLDKSFSLTAGDTIGIHQKGLTPYSLVLDTSGHTEVEITPDMSLYPTRKSVAAAFYGSSYQGSVLAGILSGNMKSLRFEEINPHSIAAFKQLTKSAQNASFEMDILPTFALPLQNATLFALLDANSNGKPDPGEQIAFSSLKPNSFPRSLTIAQDTSQTFSINSFYRLPFPSGESMTVTGRVDSNFGTDGLSSPTMVALFRDAPLEKLASDPLAYLKTFTVLDPGITQFEWDLSSTDLAQGEKVTVLAIQNPSQSPHEQTQLREGAQVGILLNSQTLETSRTLVPSSQDITTDGYGIAIKRQYYQHDGRFDVKFGGVIPMQEGDSIGIGAYRVNLDQQLTQVLSIDYDQVVALYKGSYQTGKIYSVPIFPALVPGIVGSDRKISGVLIIGWKDVNRNGKIESDEPMGFYSESLVRGVPNLVTLALTLNQLTGSITMGGEAQTTGALGSLLMSH
jgi:hypothetical protein